MSSDLQSSSEAEEDPSTEAFVDVLLCGLAAALALMIIYSVLPKNGRGKENAGARTEAARTHVPVGVPISIIIKTGGSPWAQWQILNDGKEVSVKTIRGPADVYEYVASTFVSRSLVLEIKEQNQPLANDATAVFCSVGDSLYTLSRIPSNHASVDASAAGGSSALSWFSPRVAASLEQVFQDGQLSSIAQSKNLSATAVVLSEKTLIKAFDSFWEIRGNPLSIHDSYSSTFFEVAIQNDGKIHFDVFGAKGQK